MERTLSDGKAPSLPEGFGRAASKLADTVRHVVDLVAGPERLRAKAQAQADAAIISAEADLQIQDLRDRAVDRLRKRETRRQKNIESITEKAVLALPPPEQVSKDTVSEDWTTRFFEECQDIGEEEMQRIWAQILAREVAKPKSFAPRTLSVVKDLTADDAKLFSDICSLVWFVPGAGHVPIIHDVNAPLLKEMGISFVKLVHLSTLGLLEFNNLTGFVVKRSLDTKMVFPQYCGVIHSLESSENLDFPLGKIILTAAGQQLLHVVGATGKDACKSLALDGWAAAGWSVKSSSTSHEVAS